MKAEAILAGHFGYLTPDQQKTFDQFKETLTSKNLLSPSGSEHDDATLLRFLRARSFDAARAQKQFTDAEAWRAQNQVAKLYANATAEEMEKTRSFYPRWTGRRDKNGLPIYVFKIASLGPRKKELDSIPADIRFKRMIALYEHMTKFVLPLCSQLPHSNSPWPVASVTTIVDLKDVSFSALWNFRSHLQQASTMATANYPETLSVTFVVNSPSFFPTVWGWIKPWFDVGTRSKIHVLGTDHSAILELIEKQNLPKPYGGDLEWAYDPLQPPQLDEQSQAFLGPQAPQGPVFFVDKTVIPVSEK